MLPEFAVGGLRGHPWQYPDSPCPTSHQLPTNPQLGVGLQKPRLCSCSGFDWLDFVLSLPADVSSLCCSDTSGTYCLVGDSHCFCISQPFLSSFLSWFLLPSFPPSVPPFLLFGNIDTGSHCAVLAGLARLSQSYCLFPCNGNWALEGGLWYRCPSPSCSEHLAGDLFIAGIWVLFCCFSFIPGTSAPEQVCELSAPQFLCSIAFHPSVEVLKMPVVNCFRRVEMPIFLCEVVAGSSSGKLGLNKGTDCLLVEEGHMGWDSEEKPLVAVPCDSREDTGKLKELGSRNQATG